MRRQEGAPVQPESSQVRPENTRGHLGYLQVRWENVKANLKYTWVRPKNVPPRPQSVHARLENVQVRSGWRDGGLLIRCGSFRP